MYYIYRGKYSGINIKKDENFISIYGKYLFNSVEDLVKFIITENLIGRETFVENIIFTNIIYFNDDIEIERFENFKELCFEKYPEFVL